MPLVDFFCTLPGGLLIIVKIYGLLTKHEVKMAGYWPSSFLRVYGQRQSRDS